jgi:hypothetical protein
MKTAADVVFWRQFRRVKSATSASGTIYRQGVAEPAVSELRGDARTIKLLGASVEGNVDTVLPAVRGARCRGRCECRRTDRRRGLGPRLGGGAARRRHRRDPGRVTDVLGELSTDTESDALLREVALLDCQWYGTAVLQSNEA